jgi:hypothetical protein
LGTVVLARRGVNGEGTSQGPSWALKFEVFSLRRTSALVVSYWQFWISEFESTWQCAQVEREFEWEVGAAYPAGSGGCASYSSIAIWEKNRTKFRLILENCGKSQVDDGEAF